MVEAPFFEQKRHLEAVFQVPLTGCQALQKFEESREVSLEKFAGELSTTALLLEGAKAGDETCRNQLAEHCLPALRRMACGFLPRGLRRQADPEDIVQETLLRAFTRIENFQPRCQGAFLLYLRRILWSVIADLGRKEKRSPRTRSFEVEPPSPVASPVEETVGREVWERYREAVASLGEKQQQAVVLFVECGMTFDEIKEALESPSANAARMVVARGIERLAERMHVQ